MIHFQLHLGHTPRVSKVFQLAPHPPSNVVFAAFAIASVAMLVMSPRKTRIDSLLKAQSHPRRK